MAWTRKSSLPQCFATIGEHRVEAGRVGHVAMAGDKRAEFGGQRLDALLEGLALIGQRDLGALVGAGLGDAPGDRAVVGDAKDQAPSCRPSGPVHPPCDRSPRFESRDSAAIAQVTELTVKRSPVDCLSHRQIAPSS